MKSGMDRRLLRAAAVMGLSGLPAQLLLLRELLIVFAGNELTIGIVLACWLLSEATGSLWTRRTRFDSTAHHVHRYAWVSTVFCLSLFPALYAVRMIKPILGISVGTVPGLGAAVLVSLPAILPVGLSHGALFTLGCAGLSRMNPTQTAASEYGVHPGPEPGEVGTETSSAGRIYVLETVGTLCAGLLWTVAVVRVSNPFQVAAALTLINAAAIAHLLRGLPAGDRTQRGAAVACGVLFIVGLLLPVTGASVQLHERSINLLWQNQNIVHYENTMHGNIVVTENQGQYVFFTDGTPAILSPVPDIDLIEPLVHIPLVAHRDPQRIMLIGGGASGVLDAVLQHPTVSSVTYTETDGRLLQLQLERAIDAGELWLDDPRVETHAVDARTRLQSGRNRYDVIISRYHDPANLHSSRHFSSEFFRVAAGNLTERGILVLGLPGLIGHLNDPLRDLAAGVYRGLHSEFPFVRAFPGTGQSFIAASFDSSIAGLDPDGFADRLRQRRLMDGVALPWQIEQHLHPGRSAWFEDFTADSSSRTSRDFRPNALFLSISHWSTLNAPLAGRLLQAVYGVPPFLIPPAIAVILLVPVRVRSRHRRRDRVQVIPAVVTTGFTAMLMNLTLLFAFQILVGRLFGWLGLLTAAFFAGLGSGAFFSNAKLARCDDSRRLLVQTDVGVLMFSTLLLILLPLGAPVLVARIPAIVLRVSFIPILLAAGAFCGAQFPVACDVLSRSTDDPGENHGGLVYGADLLGGCLGGIAGGVFLLPLLGFVGTGLSLALLKSISLFLLLKSTGPSILRRGEKP